MINRIEDIKTLERIYLNNKETSSILLLYAPTGVGKSCLTDYVFTNKIGASYIRIRVNQQEANETKGLFISYLARMLNKYATTTGEFQSLSSYIENVYNADTNKDKLARDFLDVAADLLHVKVIKDKIEKQSKRKEKILSEILQSDAELTVSILLDYITYISNQQNIVISIENIQLASEQLVSFLSEVIKKAHNLFLVGEYTTEGDGDEPEFLFRQFPYAKVQAYELQKLSKKDLIGGIKKLVDGHILTELCSIIEDSYEESTGNLAKLNWHIKKNERRLNSGIDIDLKSIKYDDAFHSLYEDFSSTDKIILACNVAHQGKCNVDIFKRLMHKAHHDVLYGKSIDKLISLDILFIDERNLCIKHDSIIELFKQEDDYIKYTLIANNSWLNFYRDFTLGNDYSFLESQGYEEQEILVLQLNFIINIGGTNNIDWMNYILSRINTSLSKGLRYAIASKLSQIFYQIIENSTNKALINKTYEWVVIILSRLGHSQEVVRIMQNYSPENTSDILLLLQSSARIASGDASVILELQKKINGESSFSNIGRRLLLVRYFRTFGKIRQARKQWEELMMTRSHTPYSDIILEQGNLCSYNFVKRYKTSNDALTGYLKNENIYHVCSALLNISAHAFHLYFFRIINKDHYLSICSNNLREVKRYLPNTQYPIHAFSNQKAIFQMVSKNVSEDVVLDNFKTAYFNCGIPGDKPLIGSNIVGMAMKLNKLDDLQQYTTELISLSRHFIGLKTEFARYPLINCYNYFHKINDDAHKKECIDIYRSEDFYNKYVDMIIMNPLILKSFFRIVRNYPSNIVNWDIDFPYIQQCYDNA